MAGIRWRNTGYTYMNEMRKLIEAIEKIKEVGETPEFNEHGFRTLFRNLSITGIEGDIFKVSAIDYDASNPKNMAEVDGVMLGWYDSERDQRTYIHIKDLERILQTAKSKL